MENIPVSRSRPEWMEKQDPKPVRERQEGRGSLARGHGGADEEQRSDHDPSADQELILAESAKGDDLGADGGSVDHGELDLSGKEQGGGS